MNRATLCLLAVSCAPPVEWLDTPDDARAALVDRSGAPIHAFDVRDGFELLFEGDAAVEIAFYDEDLTALGLPGGVVPADPSGGELETPTAIFARDPGGAWAPREALSAQLAAVRRVGAEPGCPSFASEPQPAFVDLGVRFVFGVDGGRTIVGDEDGALWVVDDVTSPARPASVTATGTVTPLLTAGRLAGGTWPFLLGANDGTLWRGRWRTAASALEVDRIAPAGDAAAVSWLDGTTEPVDVHALFYAGDDGRDVVWMRFDGAAWTVIDRLPQTGSTTTVDVLYVAPNEVFATSLIEADRSLLRFDGREAVVERTEPLASLDLVDGVVYGGGTDGLYRRDDGRWELVYPIAVTNFTPEPPLVTIAWPNGLLALGESFVLPVAGGVACPPATIDPDRRWIFAVAQGPNLIAGVYGHQENVSSLTYLVDTPDR